MGGYATKFNVSRSLTEDPRLACYAPYTRMYTKTGLKKMLEQYRMVYVKPDNGTGGRDVHRVERAGTWWKLQWHTCSCSFRTFDELARTLGSRIRNRPFVIQQGVDLLRCKNRLFDLRIMVQKNTEGRWETTGVIGRLGHPRKIVTNVCRGGTSRPVEYVLREHIDDIPAYVLKLKKMARLAASRLNRTFPRIKELGLDVGIDGKQRPWILEANPLPAIYGFKTLKDKSIYRKILRYHMYNFPAPS